MANELLTIRLPQDLDKQLTALAKRLHLSRSDIVRMALRKFADDFEQDTSRPYERVKNLLGAAETGISDLGSDHRKHLLERFKRA
jgi:RHH-type transcriptional regulator, rel operon repressor / antitoxin RelB